MDFNLTEEQQMLADTVQRWLAADYDLDARRALAASATGFAEANWRQLADLGLLGLNVPEDYGGLGAGAVETLLVMQAFGRALVTEPYLPTAVMAVEALVRAGTPAQRAEFLPRIVAGELRFAVAALEPESRYDLAAVATTARATAAMPATAAMAAPAATDAEGFRLTGRKAVVLQGAAAQQLIVTARLTGTAGLTLFLVDAAAPGVRVESFPTLDGLRAAEISFEDVPLASEARLGAAGAGLELIERVVDRGLAALCAEAVGAIDRLIELTADYLKSRRQFGQPIAGFQALQHRLADMLTAADQARSMALLAAARVDEPDSAVRRRALSAAKAMIGQCGHFVGQQAVQLHGGLGMTDEFAVGHYFKRLVGIDLSFGDRAHHLERYGVSP